MANSNSLQSVDPAPIFTKSPRSSAGMTQTLCNAMEILSEVGALHQIDGTLVFLQTVGGNEQGIAAKCFRHINLLK